MAHFSKFSLDFFQTKRFFKGISLLQPFGTLMIICLLVLVLWFITAIIIRIKFQMPVHMTAVMSTNVSWTHSLQKNVSSSIKHSTRCATNTRIKKHTESIDTGSHLEFIRILWYRLISDKRVHLKIDSCIIDQFNEERR